VVGSGIVDPEPQPLLMIHIDEEDEEVCVEERDEEDEELEDEEDEEVCVSKRGMRRTRKCVCRREG